MGHFTGSTNPKAVGGKGFFSPKSVAAAPITHSLVFTAGDAGAGVREWDASSSIGTTISGNFLGSPPHFGQMVDDGAVTFLVRLPCSLPAGAFTKLTFSGGLTHVLLESAAVFSPGCGFNTWSWPSIGMPIGPIINLDVT